AILAWSITGGLTCREVKDRVRDLDRSAFDAKDSYFARILGGGLDTEAVERSPLLAAMMRAGLGEIADLEVDEWLRDSSGAPPDVRVLAGVPVGDGVLGPGEPGWTGSRSPLDRVWTNSGILTFHRLGEMVATS